MKKTILTRAAGIPVGDNRHSLTAGPLGPLLVQDWQMFEKYAHFNRELIPERVVHAKGSEDVRNVYRDRRHNEVHESRNLLCDREEAPLPHFSMASEKIPLGCRPRQSLCLRAILLLHRFLGRHEPDRRTDHFSCGKK